MKIKEIGKGKKIISFEDGTEYKIKVAKLNTKIVTQCCACHNYRWFKFFWFARKPKGTIEGINGNISHGYCKKCLKEALKNI